MVYNGLPKEEGEGVMVYSRRKCTEYKLVLIIHDVVSDGVIINRPWRSMPLQME
jgi:hypothetical protein